jgi:hypothetical protein
MVREQSIRNQNMAAVYPMMDTCLHYFAGAFPESYRKPSEILTKNIRFVPVYICAVLIGNDSGFADIPTLLAIVENVVLLCCCIAIDCMYSVPKLGLQCSSDYQRHTCPTI